ncbi:MAG: N-acetyltransferase [Anaerolineae bacterium]|nr:N-acetyltransferase [Anaerolineae bacterium]
MNHNISIRPAALTDVPTIHEIYSFHVQHGLASWELTPPSLAEMQTRMSNLFEQGYPYFVAEIDGRVAGYAYAGAYRARLGYRYTVENSIYVHPQYQRKGLARVLMVELIEACEALGYRQMIAVIGDSGNTPSITLHQELGFVHIGTLPSIGFKHGRWLDCVLMQCPLGDGDQRLPDGSADAS